jgi:hypothetical protein
VQSASLFVFEQAAKVLAASTSRGDAKRKKVLGVMLGAR